VKSDSLVIAITCVGRRVQLVRHFRRACGEAQVAASIIGIDTEPSKAPACYFCDEALTVPAGNDPDLPKVILELVTRKRIGLLVPTADSDLTALAGIRQDLARLGCLPAFCGAGTVAISRDKLRTHSFLAALGLRTPRTRLLEEVLADRQMPLPGFVKPRFGSAGKNAFAVDTWDLPAWLVAGRHEFVLQEKLNGQEVTVDLFIDGSLRCVVPRHRLEVRGGEVTKSVVRLNDQITGESGRIAAGLPDAFGVVNIQGFIQQDGRVSWTEINPRFGGGSPLSVEAGARFPFWLVQLALGRKPDYAVSIADGKMMLRFDDAVYVDAGGGVQRGSDAGEPVDRLHMEVNRSAAANNDG
jgi:carbamoyl-phosphate synthase large subunit